MTKKVTLVAVVLLLSTFACGGSADIKGSSSSPTSTSSPRDNAWTACTLFIEQQYDISFLKAEKFRASKVQVGEENPSLYGMEIFYPDRAQTFNCVVLKVEEGHQLVFLEPK